MAVEMVETLTESDVRSIVREELSQALKNDPASKKICLIASKGSLDWAYPPLILGSAAAAAGMEVSIFFTFYGLNILRRDFTKTVRVSPVGNPAMPMPIPMADTFTSLPGMKAFATSMMKARFRRSGVATVGELIDVCRDLGVRMVACSLTMAAFGLKERDFIDGVEFGGAGAYLSEARRAHITLFI